MPFCRRSPSLWLHLNAVGTGPSSCSSEGPFWPRAGGGPWPSANALMLVRLSACILASQRCKATATFCHGAIAVLSSFFSGRVDRSRLPFALTGCAERQRSPRVPVSCCLASLLSGFLLPRSQAGFLLFAAGISHTEDPFRWASSWLCDHLHFPLVLRVSHLALFLSLVPQLSHRLRRLLQKASPIWPGGASRMCAPPPSFCAGRDNCGKLLASHPCGASIRIRFGAVREPRLDFSASRIAAFCARAWRLPIDLASLAYSELYLLG